MVSVAIDWIKECGAEWVQFFDFETHTVSTALIFAIKFGDWESTQFLASVRDDINERGDGEGDWTALMWSGSGKSVTALAVMG